MEELDYKKLVGEFSEYLMSKIPEDSALIVPAARLDGPLHHMPVECISDVLDVENEVYVSVGRLLSYIDTKCAATGSKCDERKLLALIAILSAVSDIWLRCTTLSHIDVDQALEQYYVTRSVVRRMEEEDDN